jgi:hypothetical protein
MERWFGPGELEWISRSMRGWYADPIPVGRCPRGGLLLAHPDGDFSGARFDGGEHASLADVVEDFARGVARRQVMGTLFGTLQALYDNLVFGRRREYPFNKAGPSAGVGGGVSLWTTTVLPTAGAVAPAAPAGRACSVATTGAFEIANPPAGEENFYAGHTLTGDAQPTTCLLYDRLFDVAKTMNSTAAEAVTGVPTRYQSTTQRTADSARGNFLFVNCNTVLPATAHNWDAQIVDDTGAAVAMQTVAGVLTCSVNRFDMALANAPWFWPLIANGTTAGVKALTSMTCSALVATGAIEMVIGHPIAWLPTPLAKLHFSAGLNPLTIARILDNACLSLLEVRGANTPIVSGSITVVSN